MCVCGGGLLKLKQTPKKSADTQTASKRNKEKKWSNKPEEGGARIRITSDFYSNHVKIRK